MTFLFWTFVVIAYVDAALVLSRAFGALVDLSEGK
jgi:hypothetical protein